MDNLARVHFDRPQNISRLANTLMSRLTPVRESTFGVVNISQSGLSIRGQIVAPPHESLTVGRALLGIVDTNRNNFESLKTSFNDYCRKPIVEIEADINPISEGLTKLLIGGEEIVGKPRGTITQNMGRLLVRGEEISLSDEGLNSDAHLLAEEMHRRNILSIDIGLSHDNNSLLKAISGIFNHDELKAKLILETLGIDYRYFLRSNTKDVVYIGSSKGIAEQAPIITIEEMKERGFRLDEMILQDPRVIEADAEIPLTYDEKIRATIEGIRKIKGGNVVVSNIDLIRLGREDEVFGLAIERNRSGAVEINKQADTKKINPFTISIDDRGCIGFFCKQCFVCPQDAIEMIVPKNKLEEIEKLSAEEKQKNQGQAPTRVPGTFARIKSEGCDGCLACFVMCKAKGGDCISIIGLDPLDRQEIRLGQFPLFPIDQGEF